MRAVPVGGQYGQLTAQPPKQRTRAAGSVPLLKEMPHFAHVAEEKTCTQVTRTALTICQ